MTQCLPGERQQPFTRLNCEDGKLRLASEPGYRFKKQPGAASISDADARPEGTDHI